MVAGSIHDVHATIQSFAVEVVQCAFQEDRERILEQRIRKMGQWVILQNNEIPQQRNLERITSYGYEALGPTSN